ncbi:MAG: SDR family oxidoreductase [Oligoflexus sp.]
MRRRKVAVVTGASAGVGRAVACEFAMKGYVIALIARGKKGLEAALQDVRELGSDGMIIPLDVADYEAVEKAADDIEEQLGPIDVWVNNAMISVFGNFLDVKPEDFKRVTEVSYLGFVHGTYAALRRMRLRNRGTIVQVSSSLAYRSIPLQSAYCGAKHAIEGFTDSLRSELIHDRSDVRLTTVQLPAINTPQFKWSANLMGVKSQPVPPIYQPEIAAKGIYFAAKQQLRNFRVGAMTDLIIKSSLLAPRIGDLYLAKNGIKDQQTGEALPKSYRDNLWKPLDDQTDFGAHGDFDRVATQHSWHLWFSINKIKLFTIFGLATAFVAYKKQTKNLPLPDLHQILQKSKKVA